MGVGGAKKLAHLVLAKWSRNGFELALGIRVCDGLDVVGSREKDGLGVGTQ